MCKNSSNLYVSSRLESNCGVTSIFNTTYLELIKHDVSLWSVLIVSGIPACLIMIGSLILWFSAQKLALKLLPKGLKEAESSLPMKEIEAFVISIVGLILVVLSATTLLRLFLSLINTTAYSDSLNLTSSMHLYPLIEHLIRVILGAILLIKADGFALFLRKVRSLGLQRQNDMKG